MPSERRKFRRAVLGMVSCAVGAMPATIRVLPFVGQPAGQILEDIVVAPVRARIRGQVARENAAGRLFGTSGETVLVPGSQHLQPELPLLPGEKGYPSDIKAGQTVFRHLFSGVNLREVEDLFEVDLKKCSAIALGSSVSNAVCRDYLGDPTKTQRRVVRPDYSAELEFNFTTPDVAAPRVKNYQEGRSEPWEEVNWGIETPRASLFPRYDSNFRLSTDYLLISRLPRGPRAAGDVLLIAGTHGVGTQSIQLVFEKLRLPDIENVLDRLCESECYQALFEVSDIEHESGHSCAHDIRLVACAPIEVSFR
jgi:hypothetical protein